MNIWDYIKFVWLEVIYSVITGIYLIGLNMLNRELVFRNFEDPFQMLVYEEWKPIKFFALALVGTILILIIIFINNPILKAVMVVCGIGVAFLYSDAN